MNYCIHLKKRKNKPYCNILKQEITFSRCRECVNKEYKIKFKKCPINKNNCALQEENSLKSSKKVQIKAKRGKIAKLERNRYSVLTDDVDKCIICGQPRQALHEVFYGKNRINSIKHGMVIPLCNNHHTGSDGIHFKRNIDMYYKQLCQIYWEANIGTKEEFITVFGKNYLE